MEKDQPNIGTEIIPLGTTCALAYQLQKHQLRSQAYPFDWCLINLEQLVNVLETDFSQWFDNLIPNKLSNKHPFLKDDQSYLTTDDLKLNDKKLENKSMMGENTYTIEVTNKYGIKFMHDFQIFNQESIQEFKKKYQRRIERFRQALQYPNNIFIFYFNKLCSNPEPKKQNKYQDEKSQICN